MRGIVFDSHDQRPAIAICMATYNPPMELFCRQIESIRNQGYANWLCFISDDASRPKIMEQMRETIGMDNRFVLSIADGRRGFLHNFERSLRMIPAGFSYFALADQDDFWQPEKLQLLLEQFDEKTSLVYSNARIVNAAGQTLASSSFANRDSNSSDLASLVLSNSVTGAAALFSTEVLRRALPFPLGIDRLAHDHWLACVAMATGKVKYLADCLYDYVQHGENAIGYHDAVKPSFFNFLYFGLKIAATREGRLAAEGIFRCDVLKVTSVAQEILQRCSEVLDRASKSELQRLADLSPTPGMLLWLLWRGLKTARLTTGAEHHLALGLWGQYLSEFKS